MSSNYGEDSVEVDDVCHDLFCYAIDRSEMKLILDTLPDSIQSNRNVLEYETQLLRILTVGWAICFFMFDRSEKKYILETFWMKIQEFSRQLSFTAFSVSGKNIDYFDVLKCRTDLYVNSVSFTDSLPDPIMIIGPEFAKTCGLEDDAHVILVGSKLFRLTADAVKEYLHTLGFWMG